MDKTKRVTLFQKVLILVLLVGMVLLSWLAGHTLRYAFPSLWHPPFRETDPQTRYGVEPVYEGIRRVVVLPGLAPRASSFQIEGTIQQRLLPDECMVLTYFTSLPAKCLTPDGRYRSVQELDPGFILVPQEK